MTATPRRTRNGHPATSARRRQRPAPVVQKVLKGVGATWLARLMLRKWVLIAIGLGTVCSWWLKRRFSKA